MAGIWAKREGFDEAVILNPDMSISEANSANILLVRDNRVIRPESPHVLGGVMQKNVCEFMENTGYSIQTEKIFINDLKSSDRIIATNSMMGAAPVLSIDNMELKNPIETCEIIHNTLLKTA